MNLQIVKRCAVGVVLALAATLPEPDATEEFWTVKHG